MNRKLKALGVVLLASCSLAGLAASPAAAQQGMLTSDGDFFVVGTELPTGNATTYPGLPATSCASSHFEGGKVDSTPHSTLASGASEFTLSAAYTNCKVGIFPATVSMTSCDYQFRIGETTPPIAEHTYGVSTALICNEAGDQVHIEVYSDAGHTNRICTITAGEQEPGSHLHATDTTDGGVRIHGTITGIHMTKSGGGCGGSGTTTEAVHHLNIEISGEDTDGSPTEIGVTH